MIKNHHIKQAIKIILFMFIFNSSYLSHASMFDDIVSGGGHVLDNHKIRKWSQKNLHKILLSNERMRCGTGFLSDECTFSVGITNNSRKYLSYIVVKIKIINKTTNTIVAEGKERFSVSVVPTVTKKITERFANSIFNEAYSQLGDNYSWNYDLIGLIPKELVYLELDYNSNDSSLF